MDYQELANHVCDGEAFHFPRQWHVHMPSVLGFQLTKFMVLELVAAGLMIAVFMWMAKRVRNGGPPKGVLWNLLEVMLVYIRDEVARPSIGKHDANKYLPFLWNMFFFTLFCNLLGILPWSGSPTGSLAVTTALALITFSVVVGTGLGKFGPVGYLKSLVPHMDLPKPIAIVLLPMIFLIEFFGLFIRHAVLAVRLLANMFAGHMVLAVILSFIASTVQLGIVGWTGITVASVFASVALTLLELFVAFLQAYIFTFLSAIFIGMTVHPH